MRRCTAAIAALLAAAGCSGVPAPERHRAESITPGGGTGASAAEAAPTTPEPGAPSDAGATRRAEPATIASDEPPAASSPYEAAAAYSASHGGHVVLVIEGYEVVFAVGQNGHRVDAPHALHTATESFWGAVAVAAESDGLLDLDEPVSFAIAEFEAVRWKRDIRIRHLLHYTSGLEAGILPLLREKPVNHYERALSLQMVAKPGERFQFGPSHLAVFGEALRRILESREMDPVDYLRERILDRIGLEISAWQRDAAGNPDLSGAAGGATTTAGEWAKFGVLVRDVGRWHGETVIEPAELAPCFRGSDVHPGFGLTFWLNRAERGTARGRAQAPASQGFYAGGFEDLIVAAGTGNQRLYAIPTLDLVVVRFGEADRGWRDRDFLERLAAAAGREAPR